MNPIKQCNDPQFIAQVRQVLLPLRHIGLFDSGGNVLGGTPVDSTCRSIDLAGRFDQAQQHSTPEGGAVKYKSHNETNEDYPPVLKRSEVARQEVTRQKENDQVAERNIWFGNLSSSIDNHLALGYVHQPSARRAANPHHERATSRAYHKRVEGPLISGLVITGEGCGFDFEQEQWICPTVQAAGQIDDGHLCYLRA
jgi:hypothetical protein